VALGLRVHQWCCQIGVDRVAVSGVWLLFGYCLSGISPGLVRDLIVTGLLLVRHTAGISGCVLWKSGRSLP